MLTEAQQLEVFNRLAVMVPIISSGESLKLMTKINGLWQQVAQYARANDEE